MSNYNEQSLTMVYWCECGQSIHTVGDPKRFDRKTWNEYGKAEKAGQKVETITLAEFKKQPFRSCDCFKPKNKKKKGTKIPKKTVSFFLLHLERCLMLLWRLLRLRQIFLLRKWSTSGECAKEI